MTEEENEAEIRELITARMHLKIFKDSANYCSYIGIDIGHDNYVEDLEALIKLCLDDRGFRD